MFTSTLVRPLSKNPIVKYYYKIFSGPNPVINPIIIFFCVQVNNFAIG